MSPDCVHHPKARRSRGGFTLIELMVVIFIIGVLLAATLTIIPRVKRAVAGTQTLAMMSALSGAIQQYYNDYKAYPGPIPNSQLGTGYDNSQAPYIGSINSPVVLQGINPSSTTITYSPTMGASGLDPRYITSSENLVLGLCGGLRLVPNGNGGFNFIYDPSIIFAPDGITPAPQGPASLNPSSPKKQVSYITTLKQGDLSIPNNSINNGLFTDDAQRHGHDSMIPEFMDKYSEQLPILYYRTNTGGTAIVGYRNSATIGGSQLSYQDPNYGTTTYLTAQYDLLQNYGYVDPSLPLIGVNGKNPNAKHGLTGLGSDSDPVDTNVSGTYLPGQYHTPDNGIAYFKDPSMNNTPGATNIHLGVARQHDGFLLISAGPDRQYGTRDDITFPGP